MTNSPKTFEQIAEEVAQQCLPEERRMLNALAERDWEQYQDAVTELYMQQMFRTKIDKVIRSVSGHGKKKPGAHSENRHK